MNSSTCPSRRVAAEGWVSSDGPKASQMISSKRLVDISVLMRRSASAWKPSRYLKERSRVSRAFETIEACEDFVWRILNFEAAPRHARLRVFAQTTRIG